MNTVAMKRNNEKQEQKKYTKKGVAKHCVFGLCKSDSRASDSNDYAFLPFPKPCVHVKMYRTKPTPQHVSMCELCRKCVRWLECCQRGDGRFEKIEHITKYKYICSKHFVKQELLFKYPDPLSEELVWKLNASAQQTAETEERPSDDSDYTRLPAGVQTQVVEVAAKKRRSSTPTSIPNKKMKHNRENCKTVQTTFKWLDVETLKAEIKELKNEVKALKEKLAKYEGRKGTVPFAEFTDSLRSDDMKCRFYTGMIFTQILALFHFLAITGENITYWGKAERDTKMLQRKKLTCFEEVVLTLVRLRSGLLIRDLRYRFQLSDALISKTFTTIVQYMFNKFDIVRPLMFASREIIKENLPPLFRNLKNIRIIIDCAEFFCENSSNFEQQGNLYSSYKAHTTFKVLLGCNPNGAVMFVSELFEGSISDKQLVSDSKLLDMLEEGDLVLADRGFTIEDLTNAKRVSLNIPPFLKGRQRLTAEEEQTTKEIARKRIYIEHVVGRIKQYRLLKKILPLSMRGILSQIVFVCACLLNFQKPILPPA